MLRRVTWTGIVAMLSLFFWLGQWANIQRIGAYFPAYDPFYHYAVAAQYTETHTVSRMVRDALVPSEIMYTSLHHLQGPIVVLLTDLHLIDVFARGGPLLFWLIGMLFILRTGQHTKNRRRACLIGGAVRTSPYLLTRFSMYLPENSALLLLVLLLHALWYNNKWLTRGILIVYGYMHYRSWYVPLGTVMLYVTWVAALLPGLSVRHRRIQRLRSVAILLLIVVLSYPINQEFFASVWYMISGWLGHAQPWATIAPDKTLYVVPSISDFVQQVGIMVVSLLVVSTSLTLRQLMQKWVRTTQDVLALVTLCVLVLLLVCYFSPFIAQQVPWYRFASYIIIFTWFLAILHAPTFADTRMMRIAIGALLLAIATKWFAPYGWSGLTEGDVRAMQFVRTSYPQAWVISLGAPLYTLLPRAERDPAVLSAILYTPDATELTNLFHARYAWVTQELVIMLSTNQVKSRRLQQLPLYTILQSYPRVYVDPTYMTQVFYVPLSATWNLE